MTIDTKDAQRELHNYAMAEMRNRGINAALEVVSNCIRTAKDGIARRDLQAAFSEIARLRTDPREHLSDWWADSPTARPSEAGIPSCPDFKDGDHAALGE